jgi:hypothetical protein
VKFFLNVIPKSGCFLTWNHCLSQNAYGNSDPIITKFYWKILHTYTEPLTPGFVYISHLHIEAIMTKIEFILVE